MMSWASLNQGKCRTASAAKLLNTRAMTACNSGTDQLAMPFRKSERDLGVMIAVATEMC